MAYTSPVLTQDELGEGFTVRYLCGGVVLFEIEVAVGEPQAGAFVEEWTDGEPGTAATINRPYAIAQASLIYLNGRKIAVTEANPLTIEVVYDGIARKPITVTRGNVYSRGGKKFLGSLLL